MQGFGEDEQCAGNRDSVGLERERSSKELGWCSI